MHALEISTVYSLVIMISTIVEGNTVSGTNASPTQGIPTKPTTLSPASTTTSAEPSPEEKCCKTKKVPIECFELCVPVDEVSGRSNEYGDDLLRNCTLFWNAIDQCKKDPLSPEQKCCKNNSVPNECLDMCVVTRDHDSRSLQNKDSILKYCNQFWNTMRRCREVEMDVNGGWSHWGSYGDCSVSCGNGLKHRTRSCTSPKPSGDGSYCIGSPSMTSQCMLCTCPVDGQWGPWGGYGSCTKTCNSGQKVRTRKCNSPSPSHGGKWCVGSHSEETTCNTRGCPVDGQWGQWGGYGTCSKTCNSGRKVRSRKCNSPSPSHGGKVCIGSDREETTCNTNGCPECERDSHCRSGKVCITGKCKAKYFKSGRGENCPASQIIDTESACKNSAADVLGLDFIWSVTYNTYPAGCYWLDDHWKQAFFNTITDPAQTNQKTFGNRSGVCVRTGTP